MLSFAGWLSSGRKRSWFVAVVVAIIATGVFIRFQSSTLLLGDGWLVADNFEHAFRGDTAVVTSSVERILTEEPIARGTGILYHWFSKALNQTLGTSPVGGIRVLNCLFGGLFVFILARTALRSAESLHLRIWLVFLVLCSGIMELFFGYVENYTPAVFFALLYLGSALAFIRRGRASWLAAAFGCLVISTFMHVQGILLAPSFALLAVWPILAKRGNRAPRLVTASLGVLVAVGMYISWAFTGYGRYYLPLKTTDEAYGLFTHSHLADLANELLLLIPALPLFIAMGALVLASGGRPGRQGDSGRAGGPGERMRTTESAPSHRLATGAEWHFVILLLIPCLLFLVAFRPDLGMARDWDLFTITFIALLPLALLILKRFLPGRMPGIPLVTVPALVMSVVLAASWIGVNSSPGRAEHRYEHILTYDRTFAPYAYENLAKHYYAQGRLKKAIASLESAVSSSYNARLRILLSVYYDEDNRLPDAIRALRPVLERDPRLSSVRHDMVNLLSRAGRYDELMTVARDGTRYHPQDPTYHYVYGWLLIRQGRFQEGAGELQEARRLNPPPQTLEQIDNMLRQLREDGKL